MEHVSPTTVQQTHSADALIPTARSTKTPVCASSRDRTRSHGRMNSGRIRRRWDRPKTPSPCPVRPGSCSNASPSPLFPFTHAVQRRRSLSTAGETVFYNSDVLHCATYDAKQQRARGTCCSMDWGGCVRRGSRRRLMSMGGGCSTR